MASSSGDGSGSVGGLIRAERPQGDVGDSGPSPDAGVVFLEHPFFLHRVYIVSLLRIY